MADFRLNVTADTQGAERDLRQLNKTADSATKARQLKIDLPSIRDVNKTFSNLGRDVNDAANNIKTFYKVAKQLPGVGDSIKRYEGALTGTAKAATTLANNTKAGDILANSFNKASSSVGGLVNGLAKVGFALFGIKEILGVLQSAFGGFFQQTIGREIKLRETILKTQTTLASTNKVFRNGSEITDPYEKIVALTGEVQKRIDSIRERSIALAGVTSGEVIEVFGMVASQIGQIGGGLKEAEDLAINFAAALGTFGIPLYQARQEIGSILRGDITTDSYLAKALGITNEDVARAKTQAGGVVKFLEDRLAASVAGQRIAAQGFSGVVSNIRDLGELVAQRFGAGLLDPLLNALAGIFERLFRIREQMFSLADAAGQFIGRFAAIGQVLRERSGLISLGELGLKDNSGSKAINDLKDAIQDVVVLIESGMQRAIGAVAQIITTLQPAVMTVADAFIRLGKSFVEIKVDVFETLARALANVISFYSKFIEILATGFNLYSQLLDLPIVQEFTKLAATMGLLKRAGMDFITNALLIGNTLIRVVVPALGGVGVAIATLLGGIAVLIAAVGKLAIVFGTLAASLVTLPTMAAGVAKALQEVSNNLIKAGNDAVNTGGKIETVAGGFKNLGDTVRLTAMNLVKSVGMIFMVQAAITVLVNAFGEYQKRAEETTKTRRAELALERLGSVYRNVGDDADYATKAARDFERQLAQAEYGRATERIEEIRKRLNDLRYEGQLGIQTWSEFFKLFDVRDTVTRALGGNADQQRVGALIGEQGRLRDYQRKYEAQQNLKDAQDNIKLQAEQRRNLEGEIKDIRIRQENELFQKRQELAQKEVEIFRIAGELRIFQMEEANKKLIEGEEGASRTALEALNNYIAVRERGELEIESAKQEMAITLANMEKEIENYKLENAKTIAKIRKDAAQYEENVAKNIETIKRNGAKAQTATGSDIKQGFLVGSTGRSTGPHLDIRSPVNNAKAVVDEALLIVKAWQDMGVSYIQLSNTNEDVKNIRDDNRLRAALIREQKAHAKRATGGAIDIAVPAGTVVPRRTSTPSFGGNGGYQATSLDTGNIFLHGLSTSVASRGAVTPVTTEAPNFDQYGTPAVTRYADAVRGVTSAMERLRALQAALTEAKTAAAFDEIAKAMFPKVQIESYIDQLDEVINKNAALSAGTLDDKAIAAKAGFAVKKNRAETEAQQTIAAIQARPSSELSDAQKLSLIKNVNRERDTYIKALEKELALVSAIGAAENTNSLISTMRESTKAVYEDIEAQRLRNRLALEGFSPARIEAEINILNLTNQITASTDGLSKAIAEQVKLIDQKQKLLANPAIQAKDRAQIEKELNEARETVKKLEVEIKRLQDELAKYKQGQQAKASATDKAKAPKAIIQNEIISLEEQLRDLANVGNIVVKSATGIGSAFADAFKQVITGAVSAQEALGNVFNKIGEMFLAMATEMIAKMLILYALKALVGLFGNGGSFGTDSAGNSAPTSAPTMAAKGAAFPSAVRRFARGGDFTNSIVRRPTAFQFKDGGATKLGVMGEAGAEAVMPLRRGGDGRLGVDASGLREVMGSPLTANTTNPVLNMSFETTNIGGVEYVSRDQLEAAMAATRRQAARDGAKRGMDMTLDRLQQSPSTRNRVGLR